MSAVLNQHTVISFLSLSHETERKKEIKSAEVAIS